MAWRRARECAMSDATAAVIGSGEPVRRAKPWAGPWSWGVLVALTVAALIIGSLHATASSAAQRISHLESILKCPACTDLSIADSNAPAAQQLRRQVVQMVAAGSSDA